MDRSDIISYAVWINMPNPHSQKIEDGFRALWNETIQYWDLYSRFNSETAHFEPWLKVGDWFYLLHIESHFSPGDICGFFKKDNRLGLEDEIVAVRIDPELYIPHQGLHDSNAQQTLAKWKTQAEQYYFVSKPHDFT
jgi:hypothetical protein